VIARFDRIAEDPASLSIRSRIFSTKTIRGNPMNFKISIIVLTIAVALGGCAATSQSSDELQSATAFSLGLDAGSVTISNRQDSGLTTNYWATTRDGRKYACVRTAMLVVKSSPLCNPTNGKGEAAPQPSNALTDAYKQQQKTKTK